MDEEQKTPDSAPIMAADGRSFFILPFVSSDSLSALGAVRKRLEKITLKALAEALQVELGEADRAALADKGAKPVWENGEFTLAKNYFHDFVQGIFGNDDGLDNGNLKNSSRSLQPLTLSTEATNVLNGGIKNRSDGLAIQVRKRAVDRLTKAGIETEPLRIGQATWLRFAIESVQCIFFGTGIGMLVIEVAYPAGRKKSKARALELIQEINFDLSRANYWAGQSNLGRIGRIKELQRSSSAENTSEQTDCWVGQGLGQIAAHLLGTCKIDQDAPKGITPVHWEKVSIFTGVRILQELDRNERVLTATRLARKETSDYQPRAEIMASGIYRPFRNLTHAASIEGGAILIETPAEGNQAEHVRTFVSNSMHQAYLPLMLWAMHEYLFLTELMKSTSGWIDFANTSDIDIKRLSKFRARIYNYRFHFRFSHASAVSMHNDMFRLWREVFELRKILDEVNHDVGEADSNLEEHQREIKRHKDHQYQRMLGLTIALAGTLISIPDWHGRKASEIVPVLCADSDTWYCPGFSLHYLIIGLGVLGLAVWGWFLAYRGFGWLRKRLWRK